jgi:hypothetical protein
LKSALDDMLAWGYSKAGREKTKKDGRKDGASPSGGVLDAAAAAPAGPPAAEPREWAPTRSQPLLAAGVRP